MKRVAFHTLGCKLNFAETSTVGRQFTARGFDVVEFSESSDVYVLNTCSVTNRAEKECRQIIRRIRRQSPEAYIIVTGCYAQLRPEEVQRIEGVDLILGSHDKFHIFDHERNFEKKPVPDVFVSCIDENSEIEPAYSEDVGGRTRAFLKIQDGCDYSCSFCTIPVARGKSRSLPVPYLLEQAIHLARQGFKEIVLTGVNVGDFGRATGTSLLSLLKELDRVTGIERIRISSIEPNLLRPELIDYILQSDKVCPHFHIPLQSGSDEILQKMQRRYRRRLYSDLVTSIKLKNPDAAIGVDVITGFPGESDRLFLDTFQFLSDLPVSYHHVFTYSERPGTPAASLPDSVEPRRRFERSEILRRLSRRKRYEFMSSFVGRTLPVLYESHLRGDRRYGLTPNYIRIDTESETIRANEIVPTRITGIDGDGCSGTVQTTFSHTSGGETSESSATTLFHNRPLRSSQVMS